MPEQAPQGVPDELRLLTLQQVAEALGLSYETVKDRARLDEIPGAFKMGRLWRVRYREFKRWLDRGCPEG
jgi:excisionase family DNA binding protein